VVSGQESLGKPAKTKVGFLIDICKKCAQFAHAQRAPNQHDRFFVGPHKPTFDLKIILIFQNVGLEADIFLRNVQTDVDENIFMYAKRGQNLAFFERK
jgi:hypothetical protein